MNKSPRSSSAHVRRLRAAVLTCVLAGCADNSSTLVVVADARADSTAPDAGSDGLAPPDAVHDMGPDVADFPDRTLPDSASVDAGADAAASRCYANPPGWSFLDCAELHRACSSPPGSSCGSTTHPLNCCDGLGRVIQGQALDEAGEPLAGAYVRLGGVIVATEAECAPVSYFFDNALDPSAPIDFDGSFFFDEEAGGSCLRALFVQFSEFKFVAVRVMPGDDVQAVVGPTGSPLDGIEIRCDDAHARCWTGTGPARDRS